MMKNLFIVFVTTTITSIKAVDREQWESFKKEGYTIMEKADEAIKKLDKLNALDRNYDTSEIDAIHAKYKDELQKRKELKSSLGEQLSRKGIWNSCVAFIKDRYKFYSVLFVVFAPLVMMVNRMFTMSVYLAQPELWSSWKSDITLHELLALPKEQITSWLLDEIHKRYQDDDPIKTFYDDIAIEEENLHNLLKIYQIPAPLSWLLPVELFQSVPNRLKTLEYLKNMIVLWELEQSQAGQYNQ